MGQPLSTEYEATGDFEAVLEIARENAIRDGGKVFVHRPFDVDHLDGLDCPCRPLIFADNNLWEPSDWLVEVEKLDG